jgi:hypothetical protein
MQRSKLLLFEYLIEMTADEVKNRYDSTIGRFVAREMTNPLVGLKISGEGGSEDCCVRLAVRLDRENDRQERANRLRFAVRQYFEPVLQDTERLRCWLSLDNDPRIDIKLKKTRSVFPLSPKNQTVCSMIQYWCREAKVSSS